MSGVDRVLYHHCGVFIPLNVTSCSMRDMISLGNGSERTLMLAPSFSLACHILTSLRSRANSIHFETPSRTLKGPSEYSQFARRICAATNIEILVAVDSYGKICLLSLNHANQVSLKVIPKPTKNGFDDWIKTALLPIDCWYSWPYPCLSLLSWYSWPYQYLSLPSQHNIYTQDIFLLFVDWPHEHRNLPCFLKRNPQISEVFRKSPSTGLFLSCSPGTLLDKVNLCVWLSGWLAILKSPYGLHQVCHSFDKALNPRSNFFGSHRRRSCWLMSAAVLYI